MREEGSFTDNMGNLFKKATEVNQKLFSEAVKAMQGFSSKGPEVENRMANSQEQFGKAFEKLLKINLDYAASMVELGLSVANELTQQKAASPQPPPEPATDANSAAAKPAFILQVAGRPGDIATAQFMLDSDKDVPIRCAFRRSAFVQEGSPDVPHDFETSFAPQDFELAPRASVKVEVTIQIPDAQPYGRYGAHVVVDGFEHTHFSILLTVSEPENA